MTMRSSTSLVEFRYPFDVPGSREQLPPGRYEVLVEEELLEGLSFAAYRETGAYLMIYGKGHNSGPTEMRPISSAYLSMALKRDAELDIAVEGGLLRPSDMALSGEGGSAFQELQAEHLQSQEPVSIGSKIKWWIQTVTATLPR